MRVLFPLLSWLVLLLLLRLPSCYQHCFQRRLMQAGQGLLSPLALRRAQQMFYISYLVGLLAQLLFNLALLAGEEVWLPLRWSWRHLALLPLAALATINSQGLMLQLASLWQRSQRYWLPPQRGRSSRGARVSWLWVYLPALLTQPLLYGLLLPQLLAFFPPLPSFLLTCLVFLLLTLLILGGNANILLGILALSLVNGLLMLSGSGLITLIINCIIFLCWGSFITRGSRL